MTQTTPQSLNIDKLISGDSAQLKQLLTACFLMEDPGLIEPEGLIDLLAGQTLVCDRPLISAIQHILPGDQSLDRTSYAFVAFVDQLFNNYHKNNRLHPDLQTAVNHFRTPALISLCRGNLPWQDETSPLQFMPALTPVLFGWQPELGRAADKFLNSFSSLLSDLTQAADSESQTQTHQALQAYLSREKQRVDKLEQRLCDGEMGQLHSRHAQQLSAKTLNQQMGGKKLPASISQFLHGPWREAMRLTLLNEGQESERWRTLLRLTETLVWSVQPLEPDASPEKRQHIYDSISELSEQLREIILQHPDDNIETALAEIEAEHLKILRGESLDYDPFDLIDNTNPLLAAKVSISRSLIKDVNKYSEGQWFLYHADDNDRRIKLTLKIDAAQQLLFTNFLGIKAEQFSIEEFAFMLSSKSAVPLLPRDIFNATGEKMLHSLLRHYQAQQQPEIENAEREQEIARQQAKEKALQEARVLEQAEGEKEISETVELSPAPRSIETPVPSEKIKAQVSGLMLGAIIAFKNAAGEESTCRLAAILKHTGDYIFVNSQGLKERALKLSELTDLIASGGARIVNQGSDIRGSLEEVVNNFRTRK